MKHAAKTNQVLRDMKAKYARLPVCYQQIARAMNEHGEEAARAKAAKIEESIASARAEWQQRT